MTLQYDANGNMSSKIGSQAPGKDLSNIIWNENNKPVRITTNGGDVTFAYDGGGNRVKKTKGVNTTYYYGDTYEQRNGVRTIHLFANGQRLASIRTDGTLYYHGNHLGSASVITDQDGNLKQKIEYYPFGTYRYGASPDQQLGTYDYDGNPNNNVKYTFTDQEEDDETGLYNYDARLYDPQLGRFISADTVVPNPRDLQSFNRYSYCLNNPLVYTDPSGHLSFGFGADGMTSPSENSVLDANWRGNDDDNGVHYAGWWERAGEVVSNMWGVKGAIQVCTGIFNVVAGIATLDPGRIGTGFTQIGQGIFETAAGLVIDAGALGVGQASHIYTIPRDVINIVKSLFDDDPGSTKKALIEFGKDLAIPRYGLLNGAGWGVSLLNNGGA